MNEILVCPICGKVDVDIKHIEKCIDTKREERIDNTWK